ncbi:MAG: amidohydrolase [Hyphomonadaceae bacterium]
MEAPLEPDLAIVDAHHHLFHHANARYLIEEFAADIAASGHNILATVYCESRAMMRADGPEAMKPVGETEFAAGVAAMSASGRYGRARINAAIVAYVDLTLGAAVEPVLQAHESAAGGRLRGVRQGVYWDAAPEVWSAVSMRPPQGLMADARFREGIAALMRHGLCFDAVLFHPQLPELAALADAFPDGAFVLNHMGFPLGVGPYAGQREAVFSAWRASMAELARRENVMVKVGGCGIPVWGFDFHKRVQGPSSQELAAAWKPYVETTLALFGPARCMAESNYPADRASAGYGEIWNALKRLTTSLSTEDRTALFRGTAERVYAF